MTGLTDNERSDRADAPLWEIDHPFFCAEESWFVGGEPKGAFDARNFVPYDHIRCASWQEFAWGRESDPNEYLLFRWDWKEPDLDEGEPERLVLYYVLQKRGRFMIVSFPVSRAEEPEIRGWLAERFGTLRDLWQPFS